MAGLGQDSNLLYHLAASNLTGWRPTKLDDLGPWCFPLGWTSGESGDERLILLRDVGTRLPPAGPLDRQEAGSLSLHQPSAVSSVSVSEDVGNDAVQVVT